MGYDFVIAGGGSAASVAAMRLVREFGFSVLLLERDMLMDFVVEIARECESVGVILDNRLETLKGAA